MSKFKDMVARDNARTFMNLDEFAEKRIVVYDGVTYDGEDHAGIPVVLSGLKEKDRRQLSGSVEGAATLFIYSSMMRLTLSRSSSSVSHFSMSSRIAFSSASVTFTSFIHLAPFKKLVGFALHAYITLIRVICQ